MLLVSPCRARSSSKDDGLWWTATGRDLKDATSLAAPPAGAFFESGLYGGLSAGRQLDAADEGDPGLDGV